MSGKIVKDDSYIKRLSDALENTEYEMSTDELVDFLIEKRSNKNKIIFIGNGGSAAIAIHMTADFMKNGGMRTVSMYDSATITCLGNDYGYEQIFAKQIERIGEDGDVLIAISSSGNSPNIIAAIEAAKAREIKVVSFTGFSSDNQARQKADISVYVPCNEYGIVESIHNLILQQIVDMILERDSR